MESVETNANDSSQTSMITVPATEGATQQKNHRSREGTWKRKKEKNYKLKFSHTWHSSCPPFFTSYDAIYCDLH